eukprot:Polyplicarium_translucidae@DN3402_c0_g1_i6.p1
MIQWNSDVHAVWYSDIHIVCFLVHDPAHSGVSFQNSLFFDAHPLSLCRPAQYSPHAASTFASSLWSTSALSMMGDSFSRHFGVANLQMARKSLAAASCVVLLQKCLYGLCSSLPCLMISPNRWSVSFCFRAGVPFFVHCFGI